jgi:virginiamycin B lyase
MTCPRISPRATLVLSALIGALLAAEPARAQPPDIESFLVPGDGAQVWKLTPGPDGAIWFTLTRCDEPLCVTTVRHEFIGRITADGQITEFPLPFDPQPHGAGPYGIAAGSDGALWFTLIRGDAIGRITTAGALTFFPLPPSLFPPGDNAPYAIVSGPDGALWFTQASAIGRITTAGDIVRFVAHTGVSSDPTELAAGPDGALWATFVNANQIRRITTAGVQTTYQLPAACGPYGITAGSDGALWFGCGAGSIGRITVNGVVSLFPVPFTGTHPSQISHAPDGALWFNEEVTGMLGRITTSGVIVEYFSGPGSQSVGALTSDATSLFFAKGNYISHIVLTGDVTPPVISGMPGPDCSIWPPNHKLVTVATITVSDESGAALTSLVVNVTSSETQGPGLPDFVVSPNGSGGFIVRLKAERRGGGARAYTVAATATDAAGNVAHATSRCLVPANQGR